MRARIAPEPISTGLATVGDYRSRTATDDSRRRKAAQVAAEPAPETPLIPPVQPPPDEAPATSAFAAALLTSEHAPPTDAKHRLLQKLGRAALPAQGSLALHDRRV